jgi:hypothetical protein
MKRKKSVQRFRKRAASAAAGYTQYQTIQDQLQGGDYSGALAAINDLLPLVTEIGARSELLSLAGDCLYLQGKYAEAATTFGQIGALVQAEPLLWLRPAIGQIHSLLKNVDVTAAQTKALAAMQMAVTFRQQYQTQLAQVTATAAAGGQATIPAEPPTPARVAARFGKIFFSEGEVAIAKALFQQSVSLDANNIKALMGLAEIAVRENDCANAIAKAKTALAVNHYHAETMYAWKLLLDAGRKSGTDVLDATLLNNLSQSPAGVRARATLLIVKNLRGQADTRWQTISNDWLQSPGAKDKVVVAELRKLNLAHARITNPGLAARRQLAQAILQTPGISPGEWLSATKQVVTTKLAQNQSPDLAALLTQGATTFGAAMRPTFAHGLALACQKTNRADLAATLFQSNVADTTASAEQKGKSLWALARLQSGQGDHAGAAQSFWNYSQNADAPQRFRLYALMQYALELLRAGQKDQIEQAVPQLRTALAQISDHEVLLDVARQLRYSQFGPGKELAADAYQRGKTIALQQFADAATPALATSLIFKFSRRAFDFARLEDIIGVWTNLDETKRLWLWSMDADYWNWQELILRAYLASGQMNQAETFGAAALNDAATPPDAFAILGATYLTIKQQQNDFAGMYLMTERMTKSAPAHERTAVAYYWLALRAWKRGNVSQSKEYGRQMLLALGKDCSMYWKAKYQAAANCFVAGLENQPPTQGSATADATQSPLSGIQDDLTSLPASI